MYLSIINLLAQAPSTKSLDLITFTNQLLNGVGIVGVLLLTGLGLAITFGVMRIINLAHGEFIMLGAYTTFVMQSTFKMDFFCTLHHM